MRLEILTVSRQILLEYQKAGNNRCMGRKGVQMSFSILAKTLFVFQSLSESVTDIELR